MSTSKHPAPDRDKAPQPRTGHGSASVIARLNEQISRTEPLAMEEPADETPARETPVAVNPDPTPS